MLLTLTRTNKSQDGIFGNLQIDGNPFKCVTLENLEKSIDAGVYDVNFNFSPHFGRVMPHILDPKRDALAGGDAGLRIHWANYPSQLDGCIAVGQKVDGNAIDTSLIIFDQLYAIINGQEGLKLKILEDFA